MSAISVVLGLVWLDLTQALTCCGTVRCNSQPSCCRSGFFAPVGVCDCCQACAKSLGESCGGLSNELGTCAPGLRCLKTCSACTALIPNRGNEPCVFPFRYKGRAYDSCTTVDSANGQPWCATAVDNSNTALNNRLGDCNTGCPGTDNPCTQDDIYHQPGECVDQSLSFSYFSYDPFTFEEETTLATSSPSCNGGSRGGCHAILQNGQSRRPCQFPFTYKGKTYYECTRDDSTNGAAWCAYEVHSNGQAVEGRWADCDSDCSTGGGGKKPNYIQCRCDPNSGPQCYGSIGSAPASAPSDAPPGSVSAPSGFGYCHLIDLDGSNPKRNCYSDVTWSRSEGRFWSSQACEPPIVG